MSSYVSPRELHGPFDPSKERVDDFYSVGPPVAKPATPAEVNYLSPHSSQLQSITTSPEGTSNTPADSVSSYPYQPSDFSSSELADDPFFGVTFEDPGNGNASFLADGQNGDLGPLQAPLSHTNSFPHISQHGLYGSAAQKPAVQPAVSRPGDFEIQHTNSIDSSTQSSQSAPQLTPDTNGGGWSSDDGLAPAPTMNMASQSPLVTVSVWGNQGEHPVEDADDDKFDGSFSGESPATVRPAQSANGSDLGISRDTQGAWASNPTTGHGGLAPEQRSQTEVFTGSLNEQASRREIAEKNKQIFSWVTRSMENLRAQGDGDDGVVEPDDIEHQTIPSREIMHDRPTENRHMPGQAYYQATGPGEFAEGPITEADWKVMSEHRVWGNGGPAIHPIQHNRTQPETSQAAISRFEQQCQDNQSMISRAATWGTRRMSLPSESVAGDTEGILSGNFLKKLSISGNSHSRRPSLLSRIPSIVRNPSQLRKRTASNASDLPPEEAAITDEDRRDSLKPPPRTSSWGSKKQPPSINTALFGMSQNMASVGSVHHARSGSVSATPITSPRSPFGPFSGSLNVPQVSNKLRRPRSKTDLAAGGGSALASMLREQGGPPVAQLARPRPSGPAQDDDEEEDEDNEDSELKDDISDIQNIQPTLDGFKDHIIRLNPLLADADSTHGYLVDRIAHQMTVRYKQLSNHKVKHLGAVNQRRCQAGAMCVAQGGQAQILTARGDTRGMDPLSTRVDSSDGDDGQPDGAINSESFPQNIPMPPTEQLPAEFECQLCFATKKFKKPSDWTKHVHEDVQPFTCTWSPCKDPKMFKRKADWVRHENEGHRHIEGWRCDVDDCAHTCHRRDNFLQHLVREHKFDEPSVRKKNDIKKAGSPDRTWQRVDSCHFNSQKQPEDEPCRFCGKTLHTWKKLTVHLAKHMEQISLPVLKLVDARHIEADTIISPVQDPPPRSFGNPVTPLKQEPSTSSLSPREVRTPHTSPNPMGYQNQAQQAYYGNVAQVSQQVPMQSQCVYSTQTTSPYTGMSSHVMSSHQGAAGLMMPEVTTGMPPQPQYQMSPAGPNYNPASGPYMNLQSAGLGLDTFATFPQNSLGIHNPHNMNYGSGTDNSMQQKQQQQQLQSQHQTEQYMTHGSVSPYSHSSYQGHSGYYQG